MNSQTEQKNFSERLKQALKASDFPHDSATLLAKEFNIRYDGPPPITVDAARKWLVGESIPTQEKLRSVADWLKVRAEWLRFGDTQCNTTPDIDGWARPEDMMLISDFHRLNQHHREIAREFIRNLSSQPMDIVSKR